MAQQFFVTVPGLKKEPITIADTATVGDFCREVYHRTGISLFNGFGFKGMNTSGVVALQSQQPLEGSVATTTIQDNGATVSFNNFLIPAPAAPTTATSTTGGSLAAGTYNVRVSYVNPAGESLATNNATQVTTGATSTITITSPVALGDATGYNVYAGTGTPTKQGATTPLGTNVTLTAVAGGAALPVSNTANAPVNNSTLFTALGIVSGDELFVFNVPVGG